MPTGTTYTVSFTAQSNADITFLSVYENDSSQHSGTQSLVANTPKPIMYTVTPGAGADPFGVISFREYPDLVTGECLSCIINITNLSIN